MAAPPCHFETRCSVCYSYTFGNSPVNSIMSLRQLCEKTGKRPSKALFYFPDENKTGIAPTHNILDKDAVFSEGMLITVNWAGEKVRAEILALSGKFTFHSLLLR